MWICPLHNGHLQATGLDARGRRQYRYHAEWRRVRDEDKFDRMRAFGQTLPRIRQRVARDLAPRRGQALARTTVLATIVRLLDTTYMRVGNEEYAASNGSYGLTTLRTRHAGVRGNTLQLRFRGKSGVQQQVTLSDPRVARVVRRCQQLPGQDLFQYEDADGTVHTVGSSDVNSYLREIAAPSPRGAGVAEDQHFTAKDFRTWGGTLAAIRLLAEMPWDEAGASQRAMASMRKAVETDVARQLGNTLAVCRKSYTDPRVYAAWESGWLARASDGVRGPRQWEALALKLLRAHRLDARHMAYFEVERQVLAQMRHPAIAQIYDAGATADGHPFFAMEFIDGAPVTHWCEAHALPLQLLQKFRFNIAARANFCKVKQHHNGGVVVV